MQERLGDDKSIYLQICDMIETDILRDILLEEERVPSTNDLARRYTINPATAAKGMALLVDAGILYKKRGLGMFVCNGAAENIRQKRKKTFYEGFVAKLLQEAEKLSISREELVRMIREGENHESH